MNVTDVALVIFVTALFKQADASLKCMRCTHMPHPQDCQMFTTCSSKETCYVEQFVTAGGNIFYDSGCMKKEICLSARKRSGYIEIANIWKPRPITYAQEVTGATLGRLARQNVVSSMDVVTCLQCCHGDFCNVGGCGTQASTTSVKCLRCTNMPHPQDCQIVTTCSSHETCYLEQFVTPGGLLLYNSGCMLKEICQNTRKRSVFTEIANILKSHPISKARGVSHGMLERLTRQYADVTTCIDCCNGDVCNADGCGTKAAPAHHTTKSTTPVPTTNPATDCKVYGYMYDAQTNLCLKFSEYPKLNWTDAQRYCNSSKGQLAIITGDQKIKEVQAFYKSGGYTIPLWVGATDYGNSHVFTFTDGSSVAVDPASGRDLKNSNCLYLTAGMNKGFGPCQDKHGFICERTIRA